MFQEKCLYNKSMKRKNILIAAFIFFYLVLTPSVFSENLQIPGWYLIWHDEFNGDSIDPVKWRVENAALIKNNELQYYSPDEVSIQDGILTLKSRKRYMGGRNYTSGLVETKGKFWQTFGRFEVRAKLPKGKGIWPAHWLLPINGSWPPEIDIMELLGHDPYTVYMSNHWGIYPNNSYTTGHYTGPDFSQDFHTFTVEWDPNQIRWYVDGTQRFSSNTSIPRLPMHIILNTAVGGDWPGNPDSTTVFPQYHQIDYVRVYAKEIPGTYFLTDSTNNGYIEITPRQNRYKGGTKVKIKAIPTIGYKFSRWQGDINNTSSVITIKMDRHRKIKALFVPDPNAPELISLGKPAKASSLENELLSAENAVDGDTSTRWSSQFNDRQWIYVDLGKVCQIEAIKLIWETACAKNYRIQVSDDAKKWKTIYSTRHGICEPKELTGLNVSGRYVRMMGKERKTQYGYSLWEFEIYGRD